MNARALYKILIIATIITSNSSCKKYLNRKSNSSFVIPSTLTDMQALLDDADKMNTKTSNYSEVSSDDYFVTDKTFQSQGATNRQAYIWQPFQYDWSNEWSDAYYAIYISNLCLERIANIQKTVYNEYNWNNIEGSALFFRAYYFLNLVWSYAKGYDSVSAETDPGIPLRLSSDFNIPSSRASVKDTYKRIIQDTRKSIAYLPDLPQHVMRPSKAAAYGLLARTYLSMHLYDDALLYVDSCLKIYNKLMDYNDPALDIEGNAPFAKFNPETIFYSEEDSQEGFYIANNYFALVDTTIYASYNKNDLRKIAFFSSQDQYQMFKGNYTQDYTMFSGIATDEMYLTRAECYARLGNSFAALTDLNKMLSKRWKTGFSDTISLTNNQNLLDTILLERRKELLFRGLRWMDIKRLNKEGYQITPKRIIDGTNYSLLPNDARYALPLPTDIINETGIHQN